MKRLAYFLRPTQWQLFQRLCKKYSGKAVARKGNFLLVQGEAPVLLVAHLDTVHKEPVLTICASEDGNILMSPQGIGGDDRCGVYVLANTYEAAGKKPWLIFTCGEETGGIGARAFAEEYAEGKLPKGLENLKCMVEIDRKGSRDAVYYDCANEDFEAYITGKGFRTAHGSFSDISILAPALGVAAVNLSAGYYDAHTLHERINCKELEQIAEKVAGIVADAAGEDFPRHEYVASPCGWGWFDEDDWEWGGYGGLRGRGKGTKKDIPPKYRDMYQKLLRLYDKEELDAYRHVYGEWAIAELYADAFGRSKA